PDKRPDWIETVLLSFPSGRTAEEVVPRDAAALAWMANLGCIDLNPHPVRAEDLDHPDELRVDLDPVPGVEWPQILQVALVAKDRTVASAYSVRPTRDARVSTPLAWPEVPGCDPAAFTVDTVPARLAEIGDPWAGIDETAASLEPLLALAAEHEAAGLGDAPWPPHYDKQAGEPPRVQPSKRRMGGAAPGPGQVPPPA